MAGSLSDTVIIFDLDGTLVDSAPDLTNALNHVLDGEGLQPVDPIAIRPMIGTGAVVAMKTAFSLRGRPYPEGEKASGLLARFLAYYTDHIADQSAPFPGLFPCLETLKAEGAALAVCTNKLEALAYPLLRALDLEAPFDPIFGRDTLTECKPSGLPLTEIMRRTGRTHAVMVGDTETDRGAAKAAGVPFAYASFGYGELDTPLNKKEQRFDGFEALFGTVTELLL